MTDEQRRVAAHYERYGPVIYRRCLKLLRDSERARDATQEVFLKLTRDMRQLEERDTVLPWIYRTATHHCLNVIRDSSRRGRKEAEFPDFEAVVEPEQDAVGARRSVGRAPGSGPSARPLLRLRSRAAPARYFRRRDAPP